MEIFMLDKVLVIDDDPNMTELLMLLLKASGFEVIVCNNGLDGVQKAKSESPDVILLDMIMEGMDGLQVCTKIRTFSNVPILILSALDNPGTIVKVLDAGADDFLTKPVSSGLLISRVNTLTRRGKTKEFNVSIPALHAQL
jgi:two-component system response regulator MtrA